MGNARLLVDNVFNPRLYPLHTITANENSTAATLVASARRAGIDGWTSVTPNADAWLKARANRQRAIDMVVVDRDSNLATETIRWQMSNDDFSANNIETVFDLIQPSTPGAGALGDALGVVTHEGAWLKSFPVRSAMDHRFYVVAMGAGLKPVLSGLWAGLSWSPGPPWLPHAPRITELVVEERESSSGWIGRGRATRRRHGVLHFKFATLFDAETAAWHIEQYAGGRPMWIVPDEDRADQAFLALVRGDTGLTDRTREYFYPTLDLPYVELNPRTD